MLYLNKKKIKNPILKLNQHANLRTTPNFQTIITAQMLSIAEQGLSICDH